MKRISRFSRRSQLTLFAFSSFAIILFSFRPLFSSYVSGTADGLAHKFRLVSFMKSLEEGNIRPRWAQDQALGYGTPVFLINYIVPYYIVSFLVFVGFTINVGYQVYAGATLLFSFLAMYLLARKLFGSFAGIISASVYLLAPYHLLVVYVYEAWGEMLAFVWAPLAFFFMLEAVEARNKAKRAVYLILMTVTESLFILSHNISSLLFSPILLTSLFVLGKGKFRKKIVAVLSYLAAILATSFFWLPAIFMNRFTILPDLIAREMEARSLYYKPFSLHIANAFATIQKGVTTYSDFTIGLPILFVIGMSIVYGLIHIRNHFINSHPWGPAGRLPNIHPQGDPPAGGLIRLASPLLFFSILLGSLFMVSDASEIVWANFGFLSFIMYPFRFLFPATFAGALLGGYFSQKSKVLGGVLFLIAIVSAIPFTNPWVEIFDFGNDYFYQPQTVFSPPRTVKNMATTDFLPRWASISYLQTVDTSYRETGVVSDKIILSDAKGIVSNLLLKQEYIKATITVAKEGSATINTFYFPNWEAKVDRKKIPLSIDGQGRMMVTIPEGTHDLELIFGRSKVENVGILLSVVSLAGFTTIIAFCLVKRRKLPS